MRIQGFARNGAVQINDLHELLDSAAGSAKNARDKNTMAILPVFGKINNTFNMELDKILKSTKIMDAVRALGCGIDEEFDIDNLKYRKIVLLTDADVD